MARKPRIEFPGALYHVIARGNDRQKTFACDRDYEHFLHLLRQAKERFKFTLYAYTLMPNHLHLLVETGEIPLSKIMQSLQLNYTQFFNRKYKRAGHLFQGRYKAMLCQKESYLLELIRYIILNPLRAKLSRSPKEWRWNSYFEIIHQTNPKKTITDDILPMFGKNRGTAFSAFQKFINGGLSSGYKKEYYELKDQRILGEKEFAEDIIKNITNDFEYRKITIAEVVDIVARHSCIDKEKILSATSERLGSKGRGLVAYICKTIAGCRSKKTGKYFKRSESMISKLVKCVELDMINDEKQRQLVADIEQEIKKNYDPCIVRQIDER